jgi:hypothetical protein
MAGRPPLRTLLGTWTELGTWQRVYETAEAIEVDESNGLLGTRRRVFYDEVLLVTYHRSIGWSLAVVAAIIAGTIAFAAGIAALAAQPTPAVVIFLFALPPVGYIIARLAVKMECITIHGRRSRARVCFWLRKTKARRAFQRVCARVRHAQERAAVRAPRPGATEVAS